MRHARSDYNRIQDPLGLISEDEPVFLIRGQDSAAPEAIRKWAEIALDLGASEEMVDLAYAWAKEIEAWQATKGSKVPDLEAPGA